MPGGARQGRARRSASYQASSREHGDDALERLFGFRCEAEDFIMPIVIGIILACSQEILGSILR